MRCCSLFFSVVVQHPSMATLLLQADWLAHALIISSCVCVYSSCWRWALNHKRVPSNVSKPSSCGYIFLWPLQEGGKSVLRMFFPYAVLFFVSSKHWNISSHCNCFLRAHSVLVWIWRENWNWVLVGARNGKNTYFILYYICVFKLVEGLFFKFCLVMTFHIFSFRQK